ncbi:type I-E CRISPR-associated protein Cse2/CasB [Synechococcus sp. WH 8016]|uniref:type I-E CRISPR-associated protein Cse2/CasB n=1 Tax=Synechococcus sp. WH 8016 TaxID=166318 RepID=UPI00022D7D99|nr:type I-E CRISPR-associated protein Cse2/CasB [Synechococcus sp. WH 8016]EHA63805.1 hypothetical protein Syn8016DRAFT_0846 [Synechococcus sp. WH 8016]
MALADHIIRVVKNKPGMRMQLLTQCGIQPSPEVIADVQKSFGIKGPDAFPAIVTVARLVAQHTPATGQFEGHNAESKALGRVLRQWADATGTKDQVLKRITRCVSMDLKYSRPHIESMLNQLLGKGYQLNIGSLFGDLMHWDDKPAMPRIRLVTSFSRLNDDAEATSEDT